MNLALAEMFLWLSAVFRWFGSQDVKFESDEGIMCLVDTSLEDVRMARDLFVPIVKPGSCKGVK